MKQDFFENIYNRSYNSKFVPKEICRMCFDTANQMSFCTEEQVDWAYEDILELVIKILKIQQNLKP